jgi:putative transcriptional regulator
MKINHHLDDATIFSYVAGSLSQGMALVVASHLSLCKSCQNRVLDMEAIGGALLQDIESAEMSDAALAQALARLDDSTETLPSLGQGAESCQGSDIPAPLREYINSLETLQWKRVGKGLYYVDVIERADGICRLFKLEPGKVVLPHRHRGNELTLTLRGSYSDVMGCYTRGDIADIDEQVEHEPVVGGSEDCVCLVALDSPLKYTTLLGKFMQVVTGL